tara:strand:- start:474 stop:728 length:255 start_codon:yes stop_codon:yes gene_type:complete
MKLPKLLKISQEILGDEKNKSSERKKCLKEIQRKLKKKSKKLKTKINEETDEENKKNITKDLTVISIQRKKIIKALEIIKTEKT